MPSSSSRYSCAILFIHTIQIPSMQLHPFLFFSIFFFFSSCNIASVSSQSLNISLDHSALLSFKSSISEPLGVLSSWNQSLPYCQWPGVTCSHRHPGKVTSLDLDSVHLRGTISPSLANLSFLQKLHLPGNNLFGSIPWELGSLTRLQRLNLSANSLTGEIPGSLSHCSKLRFLSLRDNKLQGRIPANLSSLSNIMLINLNNNKLTGSVPPELGSLPNLSTLNLRTNNLTGSIPPSLGNLSSLFILDLSENSIDGSIPEEITGLTKLGAFDVILNQLSGNVPPLIYNISSMYYLGLGGNHLSGSIPPDIGRTMPNLQRLVMHGNSFHGNIPASLANATQLAVMDFSANNFTGTLPASFGRLRNLQWLTSDFNRIEANDSNGWAFLESLTNCSRLVYLSLYGNKLRGALPPVVANLSVSLTLFAVGQNELSGSIPEGVGNLVGLTWLALDGNHFTGTIPPSVGNLRSLNVLSLNANQLSGSIPRSLGNITQLSKLYLEDNSLQESIPETIGNLQMLELLDLSYNNLTGAMPKEIGRLVSLSQFLIVSYNSLMGSIPMEVGQLKNLKVFDVSENKLSGNIPSAIEGCTVLESLQMKGNSLQGSIPATLANLKGIQDIDLSRNNLSGDIPEFLAELPLQHLNLSFNEFEGAVPVKGVFRNLSAISIVGNNELCGGDPKLRLQPCSTESSKSKHSSPTLKIIAAVGASVSVILIITVLVLCFRARTRKRKNDSETLLKDQYMKVSYAELLKATNGFSSSNLLGTGSFGSVYKGVMDEDQRAIAVKVLNLKQHGASKSFIAECEALRSIRHRNLIKILSVCSGVDFRGNDFKALVYEYMPNGSLEKWLHLKEHEFEQSRYLKFEERLNIAIDVASVLDYLHHHGEAPIVHCDLKPSNVLLDDGMCAHVADFGLAKILSKLEEDSNQDPSSSIGIKGSIGYVAPEYGMGGQVATQGDVYSYGILLLEMFTGRRPVDQMFRDGLSIQKFVEDSIPDRIVDVMDPKLLSQEAAEETNGGIQGKRSMEEKVQECFLSVIQIGLLCSKTSQKKRISMDDVTKELNAVKERFLGFGIKRKQRPIVSGEAK